MKPSIDSNPVLPKERYETLDVLRGFALLCVCIANFTRFHEHFMLTDIQKAELATLFFDNVVALGIRVFILDKANTMFAVLFGIGFAVQMRRLDSRGVNFNRIYLRRLAVLLVFGLLHLFFLFTLDILHVFALLGFVIFFTRNWSDRSILIVGLLCVLLAHPVQILAERIEASNGPTETVEYIGNEAASIRQALSESGTYMDLVVNFGEPNWSNYFTVFNLSWFLYILGRLYLGNWIGRRDYLTQPEKYLPQMKKISLTILPAGIFLALLGALPYISGQPGWFPASLDYQTTTEIFHKISSPLMVLGYCCLIVLGLYHRFWRIVLSPLGALGRVALTNYIAQSIILGLVLFDLGIGLGLAGSIGNTVMLVVAVVGIGAQIVFSHVWLKYYYYGPVEWLWRALTYWSIPKMRIQSTSRAS